MAQKLVELSIFEDGVCKLCNRDQGNILGGLYVHLVANSDGILVEDKIVCSPCVQFHHRRLFKNVPIEIN